MLLSSQHRSMRTDNEDEAGASSSGNGNSAASEQGLVDPAATQQGLSNQDRSSSNQQASVPQGDSGQTAHEETSDAEDVEGTNKHPADAQKEVVGSLQTDQSNENGSQEGRQHGERYAMRERSATSTSQVDTPVKGKSSDSSKRSAKKKAQGEKKQVEVEPEVVTIASYVNEEVHLNIHPSQFGLLLFIDEDGHVRMPKWNFNIFKIFNLATVINGMVGRPIEVDEQLNQTQKFDSDEIDEITALVEVSNLFYNFDCRYGALGCNRCNRWKITRYVKFHTGIKSSG